MIIVMATAFPDLSLMWSNETFELDNHVRNTLTFPFQNIGSNESALWDFLETQLPPFQSIGTYGDNHILGDSETHSQPNMFTRMHAAKHIHTHAFASTHIPLLGRNPLTYSVFFVSLCVCLCVIVSSVRLRQNMYKINADCANKHTVPNWGFSCSTGDPITDDLSGTFSIGGKYSEDKSTLFQIRPSGYIVDLPQDTAQALNTISTLRSEGWIGTSQSDLYVDLTLYNPNQNYFSLVKLQRSRTSSGAVVLYFTTHTVSLFNKATTWHRRSPSPETSTLLAFVLVCAIFYAVSNMVSRGIRAWARDMWNWYDNITRWSDLKQG